MSKKQDAPAAVEDTTPETETETETEQTPAAEKLVKIAAAATVGFATLGFAALAYIIKSRKTDQTEKATDQIEEPPAADVA